MGKRSRDRTFEKKKAVGNAWRFENAIYCKYLFTHQGELDGLLSAITKKSRAIETPFGNPRIDPGAEVSNTQQRQRLVEGIGSRKVPSLGWIPYEEDCLNSHHQFPSTTTTVTGRQEPRLALFHHKRPRRLSNYMGCAFQLDQ